MTQEALDLQQTKLDRMRYTKDKTSANLIILAIVLDCLYFVSIYQSNKGNFYYEWFIGASIIYNLLFLLTAFLASEGVKSRRNGYTGALLFIGVMQFVRIFYLPAKAHNAVVELGGEAIDVMSNGQYIYVVVCLAISGACCLAAAVNSYLNCKKLAEYMKTINQNVERVD